MPENDATLLRRFAENSDQSAFAEITQRHINALYSAARRRVSGDEHLARDVVQDAFISLAQHAGSLTTHQCLIGWLYAVTRNAATNRIRTEIRRRDREQKAHAMDYIHPDSQSEAVWTQLAPFLEESIDRLNKTDRHAILLRFFEHHSYSEIGKSLSLSEDGARMRVDRALDKLRQLLAQRGIRSTAAALGTTLITNAVSAAPAGLATCATDAALQVSPSLWNHLANLLRSFRPAEKAILAISALVIASALIGPELDLFNVTAPTTQLAAEQHEIDSLQQKLQDLKTTSIKLNQNQQRLERELDLARKITQPTNQPIAVLAGGRRTELSARYHALYRSQGFTDEQIDRFETIQLQASENPALWVFDQTTAQDESQRLTPAEVDAQLESLLGKDGFQQYQQYNRLLPARSLACQVASSVYLTDPLDRAKSEQLVELLGRASPDYQAGGKINLGALDWEIALTNASKFLSTAQCAALAAIRQEASFQQLLAERVHQLTTVGPPAAQQ